MQDRNDGIAEATGTILGCSLGLLLNGLGCATSIAIGIFWVWTYRNHGLGWAIVAAIATIIVGTVVRFAWPFVLMLLVSLFRPSSLK